jgi:hypothetical protein
MSAVRRKGSAGQADDDENNNTIEPGRRTTST